MKNNTHQYQSLISDTFLSVRTVPLMFCLAVLVVTAGLCVSVLIPTTHSIIRDTRDHSESSIHTFDAVTRNNTDDIVGKLMSGIHTGTFEAVRGVIDELGRFMLRYNSYASLFISKRVPRTPNNTHLFVPIHPEAVDDTIPIIALPEFFEQITKMLFADMIHLEAVSYVMFTVYGGKNVVIGAGRDVEPDPSYGHLLIGLRSLNETHGEYCPIGSDAQCNTSYVGTATYTVDGITLQVPFEGFPWVRRLVDFSTGIPWLLRNNDLLEKTKYMWTAETQDAHWTAITLVVDRERLEERLANGGSLPYTEQEAFAAFAIGFDVLSLTKILKKLPQSDGQRVFLVVAGYELWWVDDTVQRGRLLASSHGKVANVKFSGSSGVDRTSILATESDDAIVSSAGEYIHQQYINNYGAINPNSTILFSLNDTWASSNVARRFGRQHYLRSALLYLETGIQWSVVVTVPYDEVMMAIDENNARFEVDFAENNRALDARLRTGNVVVGVVLSAITVAVFLVAYIGTLTYTMPLIRLRDAMAHVAVMELEAVDVSSAPSKIPEVGSMQTSFVTMVRYLKEFRAFMPEAVLTENHPVEQEQNPLAAAAAATEKVSDSTNTAPVEVAAVGVVSQPWKENDSSEAPSVRLDMLPDDKTSSQITTDDPRVARLRGTFLRPFSVSLLSVQYNASPTPDDGDGRTFVAPAGPTRQRPTSAAARHSHLAYQEFVGVAVSAIERAEGVIVRIEANRVVGAWNAFRPCAMHETLACAASMELENEISQRVMKDSVSIFVSGGNCLVGFLGTEQRRSPVIIGECTSLLDTLLSLCPVVRSRILVTEYVVQRVVSSRFKFVAVDVVALPHTNTAPTMMLYELLNEETGDSNADVDRFKLECVPYNIGFSRLRNLKLSEAMASFKEFLQKQNDKVSSQHAMQATRLMSVCEYLDAHPEDTVVSAMSNGTLGCYARTFPAWPTLLSSSYINATCSDCNTSGSSRRHQSQQQTLLESADTIEDLRSLTQRDAKNATPNQLDVEPPSSPLLAHGHAQAISPRSKDQALVALHSGTRYFRSRKVLGKGAHGAVLLGLTENGLQVALKVQRVNTSTSGAASARVQRILGEIRMMSQLRHDNIVAMLDTVIDNDDVIVVQEFVSGGTLGTLLEHFGTLPVKSVQRYLREILHGVAYLHDNDIMHRDLKPHNVLITIDGQAKVADFGAAAKLATMCESHVGTPLYMSPEACRGQTNKASDVWAIGVIAVQLLTGDMPFDLRRYTSVQSFIARMAAAPPVPLLMPPRLSTIPLAEAFVNSCLECDPERRPTVDALLLHEFLL
eukprot:PhM_4_TR8071/c0_g1_i1/m.49579/K17533/MAP3K19, YSK4; mitogen-activated protein kinase kinase kinase 19